MLMAPRLKWMVAPAVIFELLLAKRAFGAGNNPAVIEVYRLLLINRSVSPAFDKKRVYKCGAGLTRKKGYADAIFISLFSSGATSLCCGQQ